MNSNALIIERPELQSVVQKYGWTSLTLLFWALYVYLWLPLISFVMWAMGGSFIYEHMFVLGGYVELLQTWGWYSLVIVGLGLILLGWARFNYWRFRGVERRRAATEVSTQEQAVYYGVSAEDLSDWQGQGNLTVHMNAEGQITSVGINTERQKDSTARPSAEIFHLRRFNKGWQTQRPRFAKPAQSRLLSQRASQLSANVHPLFKGRKGYRSPEQQLQAVLN